ncbi:MAG: aspartate aminotransferase family protein [Deltaproteobacteria bacterium]|nr:aspartate aminotransferase family protein [Deltaproteobacteria bacterium]
MPLNLEALLAEYRPIQHDLFAEYVNPQLVKVLRTIGYDKTYVRAEGPFLYDQAGLDYLDFLSGYGVFNMGRNHPKIRSALKSAIDAELPNMIQMDAPLLAGILAKELLAKVGGRVNTVFFTNSGTEANEGALKFARKATGRPRILFFDHAFHGLSTGSLAVNGNTEFRKDFGDLLPGCMSIPMGCLDTLRKELAKNDVAALILEPVQGKGVYIADAAYYKEAEALCRNAGTLLIVDEVQSGMGRTGKWFAHQHFGITPDIVTVAKALSGGFIPVGAICYTKDIYSKVFRSMEECVVHSNTFGRNALAMVAGLASLKVIEDEGLIENAAVMGKKIVDGVNAMKPRFEMLREARGLGLMIAIEFGEPKSISLKAGWKLIHAVNHGLFGQMVVVPLMRDHRILTQVAGHHVDIVKLLPPLIINASHADRFLSAFEQVMTACHRFPGAAWSVGKDLAMAAAKASTKNSKLPSPPPHHLPEL